MRYLNLFVLVVALLAFTGLVTYAQDETCPTELEIILDTIQDSCEALGRNQVCYGNRRMDVEAADDQVRFSQAGDIMAVNDLISLQTYPLSMETNEWGITVLRIQANFPDTLPGENVTFIVFGEAEIQPDPEAPQDYQMPMQAVYLKTGIGVPACGEVPEGGVLVQTPPGSSAELMINGFELRLGSTLFIQAEDTNSLTISTLEGNAHISSDGVEQDIPAGFTLSVTHDAPPETPIPDPAIEILPSEVLPEAVPQVGEPGDDIGQTIGLLNCANTGGVDVAAGSKIALRGGWAEYDIGTLIAFTASMTPTVEYDGESIPYGFRTGPDPWSGQDGDGFVINWFWIVDHVTAGTHQAAWHISDATFVCEIRAS